MSEKGELDLSGAKHNTGMWLVKVASSSEEEDNIIGLMPAKGPVESDATKEFECRAQRMKDKLTSADSVTVVRKKTTLSKGKEETILPGREKSLAEQVTSNNETKRSESLLDIHQQKLKSKASGEKAKPQERRLFDREQDLEVSQWQSTKKALVFGSLLTKFEYSEGNVFL